MQLIDRLAVQRAGNVCKVKFLALSTFCVIVPSALGQTYNLTDLGAGEAKAINSSGQVAISDMSISPAKGFLWSAGVRTDVGTLGSDTWVNAISDTGKIVGTSRLASGANRAFIWSSSAGMKNLGVLSKKGTYSFGFGLNNLDRVVGEADASQGFNQRAFLWQANVMTDLGTLGAKGDTFNRAAGINDAGQVVGFAQPGRFVPVHPFLYQSGRMVNLGSLPGYQGGQANAINAGGYVAGHSGEGATRAFLWTPTSPNAQTGSMQDLGALYGSSTARAINSSNVVVGGTGPSAMVWDAVNGMRDLNFMLDASGAGWHLDIAYGINASGQIVGSGRFNGVQRAFLLTPNP